MKFSVIIPVYNVEKYLARCLDSVLCQNFMDYEILAVNDGSTDESEEILRKYKMKTDKLKVITQENKGLGGARNTGIINASGEYLVFLDSDDYIEFNMLKELNTCINEHNVDILAFDGMQVKEDGKFIDVMTADGYKSEYTDISVKQFMLFEPTACTKIYRRKLFVDNDIFFPERLWYEDFATVFRLASCTDKIGYLKKSYYYYTQQPDSITHSSNINRFAEITKAFDMNVKEFKNRGLFNKYYEELEWNCFLHVLYYSSFRFLTKGCYIKEMKELYLYAKNIFPYIENNKYIIDGLKKYDMMNLIVKRQYFVFYMKTGFVIKLLK